jgi:hypothetical protein
MPIRKQFDAKEDDRMRKAQRAAQLDEALRKLPQVPYLRDDPTAQVLESAPALALPFPPNAVAPLHGSEYLLEQVVGKWYLRSLAVSHFCRPVDTDYRVFSQEDFANTGVEWVGNFSLTLLCVTHLGRKHSVGYYPTLAKPPVAFIPAFVSTTPLEKLPAVQAVLYLTANGLRPFDDSSQSFQTRLLSKYESGLTRPRLVLDTALATSRQQAARRARAERNACSGGRPLAPKGPWEAELFDNAFGGDTSLMSDAEYEMVFGEGR